MKKRLFNYSSIIFVLLLFGCTVSDYEVKLKKSTVEYKSEVIDVCQIISKVDNQKIHDYNREKNNINENGLDIKCPSKNVRKLGKQEVIIKVNTIDITVNFEVVDTTAPKIEVKGNTLKVEQYNEYFDIKNMVRVTDNYDVDPIVTFTGAYELTVPGTYEVKVSAKDTNKNVSNKTITIIVSEKEVEIIEKNGNGGTSGNTGGSGGNTGNTGGVTPPPSGQAGQTPPSPLSNKLWLFVDGWNLLTGYDACMGYKGSYPGACEPVIDETTGLPYAYQFLP